MAESLLPGTDAIPCGTVEWTIYHGAHLVRVKSLTGKVVRQRTFRDPGEGHMVQLDSSAAADYFWTAARELEREAKERIAAAKREQVMAMGIVA